VVETAFHPQNLGQAVGAPFLVVRQVEADFRRKAWPGITSQKFSHYRPGITGGKDVRQPIRRDRLNRQRQVRQSQSRFSVDFNTVAHFHSPGFIVPFRSKPACSAAFSHLLIVTADIDRIANVQTFYHDSDFSSEYQL
jgi:hypothetical protein